MGWSWQELQKTPWEIVERIWLYIKTEARHDQEEAEHGKGPTTTSKS